MIKLATAVFAWSVVANVAYWSAWTLLQTSLAQPVPTPSVAIDFQPVGGVTQDGYIEIGKEGSWGENTAYVQHPPRPRVSNLNIDGVALLGPGEFSIDVPNGWYRLTVWFGDQSSKVEAAVLNVEGRDLDWFAVPEGGVHASAVVIQVQDGSANIAARGLYPVFVTGLLLQTFDVENPQATPVITAPAYDGEPVDPPVEPPSPPDPPDAPGIDVIERWRVEDTDGNVLPGSHTNMSNALERLLHENREDLRAIGTLRIER